MSKTRSNGPDRPLDEVLESITDTDAERAVLSRAAMSPELCEEFAAALTPDDFLDPLHKIIARQLLVTLEKGKAGDAELLFRSCKALKGNDGETWREGNGAVYLAELSNSCGPLRSMKHYIGLVRASSVRRKLYREAKGIIESLSHPEKTAEELISESEEAIFSVAESSVDKRTEAMPVASVMATALAAIEARMGGETTVGVPSGFREVDKMTGGFHCGALTVIGARPSQGKTSLGLNIADAVALDCQRGVLFVSLEMSAAEVADRMIASRAGIRLSTVRLGHGMTSERLQDIREVSGMLAQAPLWIDDSPSRSVLDISLTARRLKRRSGLDLVIVDYLQLIQPDNPRDPRQEQVAKISRRLKAMARELGLPVIAMAQVNRDSAKDGRAPTLVDLRESGAIEQDADVVMFIHQPSHYLKGNEELPPVGQAVRAELHIAKQRNGPRGTINLNWHAGHTKFEDTQDSYAEAPARNQELDSFNQRDKEAAYS